MRPSFGRRNERGSVLVMTALSLTAVLAAVGLAVDIGNARLVRGQLQAAADAAALSATLEVYSCGSGINCLAMQNAAQSAFAENGFSGGTVIQNCGSSPPSATFIIMVNTPPCAQGASDPNYGKSGYVEVVAQKTQQTVFGALVGFRSFQVAARAEALRTPNPDCIWALDSTGGNAITVDILAAVNSSCGVMDESSAWNALSCNLIASLTAPQVNVVGGAEGFLCLPSTTPRTHVALPSPSDPLSGLPTPSALACGTSVVSPYHGSSSPLTILGTATLYPDAAYCGGITLLPTANVTFQPGTYVIKAGGLLNQQGGLTISLGANVVGSGVTFYNLGPAGGITMLAPSLTTGSVNLTAPTTGTYACILFFQDPQDTAPAILLGSSSWNTLLQGVYYFPNASILYAASFSASYNVLIAKDIEFAALTYSSTSLSSSFSNDYSSIPNGCPLAGGSAALVE